jgi:hypothetical protein
LRRSLGSNRGICYVIFTAVNVCFVKRGIPVAVVVDNDLETEWPPALEFPSFYVVSYDRNLIFFIAFARETSLSESYQLITMTMSNCRFFARTTNTFQICVSHDSSNYCWLLSFTCQSG